MSERSNYTAGYKVALLLLLASVCSVPLAIGYMYREATKPMLDVTTFETHISKHAHTGAYDWEDVASGDVPKPAVSLLKTLAPGYYKTKEKESTVLELIGVGDLDGIWYAVCRTHDGVVMLVQPEILVPYKGN